MTRGEGDTSGLIPSESWVPARLAELATNGFPLGLSDGFIQDETCKPMDDALALEPLAMRYAADARADTAGLVRHPASLSNQHTTVRKIVTKPDGEKPESRDEDLQWHLD